MGWIDDGPLVSRFTRDMEEVSDGTRDRNEVSQAEPSVPTEELFPELDIDATLALAELARHSVRRNRQLTAAEVFSTVEGDSGLRLEAGAPRAAVLVAALANLYEYTRLLADEMSTRTAGRLEERTGEELSSTSHLSGYCLGCPTTWRGSGPMVIERARLHGRHHGHTTVVDSSRTHVFQYGQTILTDGEEDDELAEPPRVVAHHGS